MCIACSEFIKNTLTLKEYKSALRETTREAPDHLEEIERILERGGSDPEKTKELLRGLRER